MVRVLISLFSLDWGSWGVHSELWGIDSQRSLGSLRAWRLILGHAFKSWMLFCRIRNNCLQDCLLYDLHLPFQKSSLEFSILLAGNWRGPFLFCLLYCDWVEVMLPCTPSSPVPESWYLTTRPCNMMITVIIYKAYIQSQNCKGAFKFNAQIKSLVSSWYPPTNFLHNYVTQFAFWKNESLMTKLLTVNVLGT